MTEITAEEYQAIRAGVMKRRAERLSAEIEKPKSEPLAQFGESLLSPEEEYEAIWQGVMRRYADKLEAWVADVLAEPGAKRFETVDEFMAFFESPLSPEDRPESPEGTDEAV